MPEFGTADSVFQQVLKAGLTVGGGPGALPLLSSLAGGPGAHGGTAEWRGCDGLARLEARPGCEEQPWTGRLGLQRARGARPDVSIPYPKRSRGRFLSKRARLWHRTVTL